MTKKKPPVPPLDLDQVRRALGVEASDWDSPEDVADYDTDSARLQPPVDTTVDRSCLDGRHKDLRPLSSWADVRVCVDCGDFIFPKTPLVIDDKDAPDLTGVVTYLAHNYGPAMYRLWDLHEAVHNAREFNPHDTDATAWQQEHDNQLRHVVSLIGEIRVGGDT